MMIMIVWSRTCVVTSQQGQLESQQKPPSVVMLCN